MAPTTGTAAGRGPLIALSSRGGQTWSVDDASGALTGSPAAGGVATALRAALPRNALWVFAAQGPGDRALAEQMKGQPFPHEVLGRPLRLQVVNTPDFGPFAEVLALIQLQQTSCLTRFDTDEVVRAYADYVAANQAMARAVIPQLSPEAWVMLNDHQIYLVPALLRAEFPDLRMWHYVHMSMSGPYDWRVLPRRMREPILRSLLECDMVAFHSQMWARQFVDVCDEMDGVAVDRSKMLVSSGHRNTGVRVFSLPADKEGWLARQRAGAVQRLIRELLADEVFNYVMVDRSDPIKNVLRAYAAYRLLLQENQELRGRVVLRSHVVPSRQDLAIEVGGRTIYPYRDYMEQVRIEAAEINREFGQTGWQPIQLSAEHDLDRACALLSISDCLMVLSLIEGMNSVAKEGPVLNDRGALVLSPSIGAATRMTSAIDVDQFDVRDIARAMKEAFDMSPGKRHQMGRQLHRLAVGETAHHWLDEQRSAVAALTRTA
jgi:trehalose 6-phosphate synthase